MGDMLKEAGAEEFKAA